MPSSTKVPRVAVWIETSRGYARGLIRGVAEYVRQHGPWSIYFTPHGQHDPLPAWLRKWRGDGILARVESPRTAKMLLAARLPMIDLSGRLPHFRDSMFGIDNRFVAQMAFDHLRERGFRDYGFYGVPRGMHYHMDFRCEYFCQCVAQAGFACEVFEVRRTRGRLPEWESEQRQLGKWLLGLPKPIGIMCCNDDRGLQLLDACRRVGVAVPDHVAVIGVDNDQELCNLATRPLSSIDVGSQRFGYSAAAMLERMMAEGMLRPPGVFLFPPSHVVTRLSTDTLAVENPALARALRFIREHACQGISVNDVVQAAVTSRRDLERQMRAAVGRSPNQEILRERIRRAQELLLETDMPLGSIARQTGFRGHKYLGDAFKRVTGCRPGEFRRQSRQRYDLPDLPSL
jgi:LacI family transcriptional regulator